MRTHLTLTGPYAGQPLCPVNKPVAIEQGDRFYHAMFFNFETATDLCPECKAEYDAAMSEDDDND